ncbi:hypothetical protein IF2G_10081 [Cordyceps javanica]|nr:hypothetical protein IF2G_10081 [Cordyceps javanica]
MAHACHPHGLRASRNLILPPPPSIEPSNISSIYCPDRSHSAASSSRSSRTERVERDSIHTQSSSRAAGPRDFPPVVSRGRQRLLQESFVVGEATWSCHSRQRAPSHTSSQTRSGYHSRSDSTVMPESSVSNWSRNVERAARQQRHPRSGSSRGSNNHNR